MTLSCFSSPWGRITGQVNWLRAWGSLCLFKCSYAIPLARSNHPLMFKTLSSLWRKSNSARTDLCLCVQRLTCRQMCFVFLVSLHNVWLVCWKAGLLFSPKITFSSQIRQNTLNKAASDIIQMGIIHHVMHSFSQLTRKYSAPLSHRNDLQAVRKRIMFLLPFSFQHKLTRIYCILVYTKITVMVML